jgi:hypothetical protein
MGRPLLEFVMKIKISLSAEIRDMSHLDEDFLGLLDLGEKAYKQGTGVWRAVGYTSELHILVQHTKSKYRVYLVESKTDKFVGFMLLDPKTMRTGIKPKFYHPTLFMRPEYRGRGLFIPLYRWVLDNGINLISDDWHSEGTNQLLQRLIKEYRYLSLKDGSSGKKDQYEQMLDPKRLTLPDYYTILFSKDWSEDDVKDFVDLFQGKKK